MTSLVPVVSADNHLKTVFNFSRNTYKSRSPKGTFTYHQNFSNCSKSMPIPQTSFMEVIDPEKLCYDDEFENKRMAMIKLIEKNNAIVSRESKGGDDFGRYVNNDPHGSNGADYYLSFELAEAEIDTNILKDSLNCGEDTFIDLNVNTEESADEMQHFQIDD